MGLLDVSARTWHAPSRSEQVHKQELYRLEDYERNKKREIKNELETLERVEHVERDNLRLNAELLRAQGHRNLSSAHERQKLALLQQEQNARLQAAALRSPASMSAIGMTPRVRTLSAHGHGLGMPLGAAPGLGMAAAHPQAGLAAANLLAQREREAALRMAAAGATPRMRTLSGAGVGNQQLAMEKLRLAERKAALAAREHALQDAREDRLRQKASMIELSEQDRRIRERERDQNMRIRTAAREQALNRAEQELRNRERNDLLDEDLERRLQNLAMSPAHNHHHTRTPSMGLHDNMLSSPMLNDPLLVGSNGLVGSSHSRNHLSPQLGGLSPNLGMGNLGHSRSRSLGNTPHLGASPYHGGSSNLLSEDAMLAEAAALGINLPSRSPHMRAFPTTDHLGRLGGLDDFGGLDGLGGSRSRVGSLASLGGGLGGYDDYERGRRESLPFEESQLFSTRGY